MIFNVTSELWSFTIPGQLGNNTVDFYLSANDIHGNFNTTQTVIIEIQDLIVGDLNGDGVVNIFDIVIACNHYGQSW